MNEIVELVFLTKSYGNSEWVLLVLTAKQKFFIVEARLGLSLKYK